MLHLDVNKKYHAWSVKIYVSLIVYIKKELNILRVAIDVLNIFLYDN